MKSLRWLLLAPLLSFLTQTGYGQIIIQKTDIQQTFAPNALIKLYSDTSRYVNVGKTGGPNVYDFSSLSFPDSVTYTLYPSSKIPQLVPRFNSSSLVWGTSTQNISGSPVFYVTDTSFFQLANVSVYADSQVYSYEYIPLVQLPTSYNLQWDRPGKQAGESDSTFVNNVLINNFTRSTSPKDYAVDGYGTLMAKGRSVQCLRVREIDPDTTYIGYSYYTKAGVVIFIDSYQNSTDTGVVIVKGVNMVTNSSAATPVLGNKILPTKFLLSQNYPNPFNPSTIIQFTVPSNGHAVLKVFNVLGQKVATLFDDEATAGIDHQVHFDASNLASGIYFSRLEFGGKMQVKQMLLLK